MSAGPSDLFARARSDDPGFVPLAVRMRPRTLGEIVGQAHLVGPQGLLRQLVAGRRIPSMIFWGPPGTGKTTLARVLAADGATWFEELSATEAGVKDIRAAVERARQRRDYEGRPTLLFVDEIHRFSRSQQDALLPHVEAGVCSLVGATTENPGFEINGALLSRARVVRLEPIGEDDLVALVMRALNDAERGLGLRRLEADDEAIQTLARAAHGDARRALSALELAADLVAPDSRILDQSLVLQALGVSQVRHDKSGDAHFDVVSALIKSMRASDPDAAVYWLARMVEGGEDPMFIARRLVIFAAEDIGNAEPGALALATAAAAATHLVGLPEAVLPLTEAVVHLSLAPKSNTVLTAYSAAREQVRIFGALPVPQEVRNAATAVSAAFGAGVGYRYPHEFADHVDPDHASYLPEALREPLGTRKFVRSGALGWEARAEAWLAAARKPDPK